MKKARLQYYKCLPVPESYSSSIMHLPINNIYNETNRQGTTTRTTKHEKIRPGYIITRVNTNKQLIDLTKTMNCVLRKWGEIGISPRVSKKGAEAAENS
jgi:hypothetical protein